MTRSVYFSGRVPFTHCESFYLGEGAAVHYDSHSLFGRGSAYCTYCKAEIFSLINEEKWMVLRGCSQMKWLFGQKEIFHYDWFGGVGNKYILQSVGGLSECY